MDERIIAVYCLCDDCLKALHHYEDPQGEMGDAEVMTTAMVAALFFRGNLEAARTHLQTAGWIPRMLSRSRYHRRWQRLRPLFLTLFSVLGETWKELNAESIYRVDSFPVAVCDHYRLRRAKLYRGESYRGGLASKKRWFYGLKVHLLVTPEGQPVEFFLTPGSFSDVGCLQDFDFDWPAHSTV